MICMECNGKGLAYYHVVVARDENTMTMEKKEDICRSCNGSGRKIMSNADCIRAMSDEELAGFLDDMQNDGLFLDGPIHNLKYTTEWLKWLRQPAEG